MARPGRVPAARGRNERLPWAAPCPPFGYNRASRTAPFPTFRTPTWMQRPLIAARSTSRAWRTTPLVRGLGRYAADAPLTGQAFAYFVRSPHAIARISIHGYRPAKAAPGVLAVLTADDMDGGRQRLAPSTDGRRGGASSSCRTARRSRARRCDACGPAGRGRDRRNVRGGARRRRAGRRRLRGIARR